MEAIVVEVRAAEGGADARDLTQEQFAIYTRLCASRRLAVELVDIRPGSIVFRVLGLGAATAFQNEPGGHRWQRVPPTEKRGRVHSSSITVAVLPEPTEAQVVLHDKDMEWTTCRGSGPGGQARNVTASAFQVKHLPTGLIVRCDGARSQHQNKATALATLRARIWERKQAEVDGARADTRRQQHGSGERSDKRRTVAVQRGTVVDHMTGRRWRVAEYLRGDW